ncbi:MAG: ATP-binding protein [Oscillospiraceae bacterium]|nr:ATP-binding protein [Oscillospiraceae bacterium]
MLEEQGRIPHACLICAPREELAREKARELAMAAVCTDAGKKPCGVCRDCRKAQAGIHPDVITVSRLMDEKGKQKQNITVDQIRALAADAVVLPNEAQRKVYILEEAETMNAAAQNAALKLLEEPPAGAVFLLCTTRPMQLLETVRSRCAAVKLTGGEGQAAAEDAAAELAAGYLHALNTRDEAQILRWCVQNEGLDTQSAAAFLDAVRLRLADMLCLRAKSGRLSRAELRHLYRLCDRCTGYLKVNTNVRQIFGLLAVCALPDGNRGNSID